MFDITKLNVQNDLWVIIKDDNDYFKEEFYKEINKEHILHNIDVNTIARREDCDDVLLFLLDGSERYAVVHLTWSSKMESNSSYPKTRIYDSLAELVNVERC